MAKSNEKWIWLPDWASDLSLWQDDLTEVESSADHTFVPYETMVDNLGDLYRVSGLPKADVVVGWGMGAFLLLKNHAKKPAAQRWILLSPYADFCDEASDWTATNLHFMARQMQTTTEPGLNSFAEQFEDEFGEWQDDWMDSGQGNHLPGRSKNCRTLGRLRECGSNLRAYGPCRAASPDAEVERFTPGCGIQGTPQGGTLAPAATALIVYGIRLLLLGRFRRSRAG